MEFLTVEHKIHRNKNEVYSTPSTKENDKSYLQLAEISFRKKEFDKAYVFFKESKRSTANDKLAYIYWKMGLCKEKNLMYSLAIEYYKLSENYSQKYNDIRTELISNCYLANVYRKMNRLELAMKTIDVVYRMCNKKALDAVVLYIENIKAMCMEENKDYEDAINICNNIISKTLHNKNKFLAQAYNNLGRIHYKNNDIKESMHCFTIAEALRREIDKGKLARTLIDKAEVQYNLGFVKDAMENIALGLKYSKYYKDLESEIKIRKLLARIYEKRENYLKLEDIYISIIKLLDKREHKKEIKIIYNKIAEMYLKQNKIKEFEKYMELVIN